MSNRLAQETSPYLQQHADNPVDWYPWGPEALARARREDRPILLSVGYSACHWCHVMAHESFEDAQTAAVMNSLFVNVKVDREERPDLDQIYQLAHQMLARRPGGWPLTMFLAPDGSPFFGGTYFPNTPRHGLPGFADLCRRVAEVWSTQRKELNAQGEQVREALARTQPGGEGTPGALDDAPVAGLMQHLARIFDPHHGGFGGAPKFPHPTDLEFCLRRYALTGDREALGIAATTLQRMCDGGIYDQLGGGFSRYSVDERWEIPHFEKMLYDNGPLLALLADAWIATREDRFARCAEETAAWVMREMQSPEGGYYSSLDADSEHEEGKFYVWDRDEIKDLLLPEEFRMAAPYFGLDREPNFEGAHWHLQRACDEEEAARRAGLTQDEAARLLASAREKLLAVRERRIRPGRDDKILVSWNALATRGMVHAGRVFGRPDWIASARRALDFIRSRMWRDGRLLATYKDGRAHLNAYLDDYAFLLAAVLESMQARFSAADLRFARALADALLTHFEDAQEGGFFFTSHDHEQLIHRSKPGHDNATPSGNGVAAWALQRMTALTGEPRYADAASRALRLYFPAMREHPGAFASLIAALEESLSPPSTLILTGEREACEHWLGELVRDSLPQLLCLHVGEPVEEDLSLILNKPARSAAVNAWLCQGVTCLPPMSELSAVKEACKPLKLR